MDLRWHSMEGGIFPDEQGNRYVYLGVTIGGVEYMQWYMLPEAVNDYPELFASLMDLITTALDYRIEAHH